MARTLNRLTAREIGSIKTPGLHADGGGLYFSTLRGARRWVMVYQWQGKRRELGLGTYPSVSLARARELAFQARDQIAAGINPIDARRSERAPVAEHPPSVLTFGKFAEDYIASVEEGWRNKVHRQQWRNSLRDHAAPLAAIPIDVVATDHILSVLQPIWLTKPETASRIRGRIEKILAAAKARGLRPRDAANPAQWRGHLDVLLPKQPRMVRGHHAAMPYSDLPTFMTRLAQRPAIAARALEFLIHTASRTSEVLGARWGEIDKDLWSIPADRMKAGVPHTVTLSMAAVGVLNQLKPADLDPDALVFPGQGASGALSNMSMEMLMRRMNVENATVHGFRSAFKDWAANCTEFPDELSEEALAHIVGNKVRRAYRRGAALDRRRKLMEAWSGFLTSSRALEEAA